MSLTHATMRRCSSGSSSADSPVEPATTTPSSPSCTRRVTLSRRWTGATSPVVWSNGVVMGASTPASCRAVTAPAPPWGRLRGRGARAALLVAHPALEVLEVRGCRQRHLVGHPLVQHQVAYVRGQPIHPVLSTWPGDLVS